MLNVNMRKSFGKHFVLLVLLATGCAGVQAQTISGNVFGGGRMANVDGTATVVVNDCDAVESVYGANDISGNVDGGTDVTVKGGLIKKNVFGGGNGFYACNSDVTYLYDGEDFGLLSDGVTPDTNVTTFISGNPLTIPTVNITSVSIEGGEILGSVYAGGNLAYVGKKSGATVSWDVTADRGVASLSVTKGHIYGNVFAGGNMASIFGKTSLTVNGDYSLKIDGGVYGGNDKMGTISGSGATAITASNGDEVAAGTCYVKIQGTPIIGQVFGGGNGDYDYETAYTDNEDFPYACLLSKAQSEKPVQANSYVDLVTTGGRIAQAFAGGNGVSVSGSATIVLNGSNTTSLDTVTVGQIFGGNNVAEMDIVPTIKLVNGHANEVYGGGNAGNMTGSKTINSVDYGTVIVMESDKDVKVNTVYGGCNMANVDENTLITLNSSTTTVETIYGGCNISGSVPTSYVTLTDGTVTNRVFGGANGAYGCNDGEKYTSDYDATDGITVTTDMTIPTITNTHVVVNGATMTNASVYGGGNMAPVSGSTDVNLTKGTLGSAFGGGNKATVTGVANIYTPSTSTITVTNIFGGNDKAGTVKGTGRTGNSLRGTALDADNAATYVKIEGKPNVTNIYGGGNGAYNYNDEDMFKCGESAPDQDGAWVDINTTSTSIGTVYGGSKAANIDGTATVDLLQLNSPNSNIFGGNDIAGTVAESVVNMDETTADKVIVNNIYGGGNGHYDYVVDSEGNGTVYKYGHASTDPVLAYSATSPLTTTTHVNLTDGQVKACAYGGGMAGDVVTTNVVVDKEAVIDSTLFGGGCGDLSHIGACGTVAHVGNVTGSANLTINSYNKPAGKVYGGGRAGDVAFANITIPDPDTTAGAVINFAELYGGCYGSDLTQTATITIGEDTAFADTKINIGTIYGGNDYAGLCQNTVLTINSGTYNHVYGAGNGVYDYGMTTWVMNKEQTCNIVPYSMNVEITFNGGHYLDHVYGGGNMGLVGDKYMTTTKHPEGSVNNNMYGYIHVTIHDGLFENRVFGGACGTAIGTKRFFGLNAYGTSTDAAENARNNSTVLAYAYKQVDMDGGEVHFSLHGGSEGVDDGHPYECWDSIYNSDGKLTATTLRPSSMVNITGGTINKSVYGGGYEGNTFGSIYVNVGRDAIRKCPAWNAVLYREGADVATKLQLEYDTKFQALASAAKYGLKTGLEGHDLYLLASVYNGSDWGQGSSTQTQYFNTRGFYGGKGLVYIDGKGYQTSLTRMSTDPQMNIVSSVFGSGTSTAEADVNSQIWIHNYGDWSCPTPSRQLHSVQRANYLELYKSNITFLGESDAFASHSTNTRSLNRLDTVYFVKTNVIEANAPMEFIGLMASIKTYPKFDGSDAITYYDAQTMNEAMTTCDDISTNPCDILTNNVTAMNVVVINNGSYITVQPFTPEGSTGDAATTHNVAAAYGPVLGYFYLLPQQSTQATVAARQKISGQPSADDGGFVSPCSLGNSFPSEPPYEIKYVNMSVTDGNPVDFRSWKIGTDNSSRKRSVTVVAHADPTKVVEDTKLDDFSFGTGAAEKQYKNFAYAKTTVTLPPSDAGHYYSITSVIIDDDNNGQINLVDYAYNPVLSVATGEDSLRWWNPYEQKTSSETDEAFTDRKFGEKNTAVGLINADPSYTFGMMFNMNNYFDNDTWDWTVGSGTGAATYTSKRASVVSGNANLTTTAGFTSNKIVNGAVGVLPTMDFYLTYNTEFATTVNRNVRMTLMEYVNDETGAKQEVGPIEITVTISTIISDFNDIEAPLLAMYNAGTYNEYVRKVMIPASFEERELYVTGVEWVYYTDPGTGNTTADHFHIEPARRPDDEGVYYDSIPLTYDKFGIIVTPTQDVAEDISNTLGWYDISSKPAEGMDIHQLAGVAATEAPSSKDSTLSSDYYTFNNMYKVGVLDGRAAAALDVKLLFNGDLVYYKDDICGTARVHFATYPTKVDGEETPYQDKYKQNFDLLIRVRTRMSGDTIYMAEPKNIWVYTDGSYTYLDDTPETPVYYHVTRGGVVTSNTDMSAITPTTGVYQISQLYRYDDEVNLKADYEKNDPIVYLNTFEKVFKIYDEGDVIDIMGPIHINNPEKPITVTSAAYSYINVIRYSGSHVRWPGELYTYRGPMMVVEKGAKLTLSGIYIDGSGCTRTAEAETASEPTDANSSYHYVPGDVIRNATTAGNINVISNANPSQSWSIVTDKTGSYKKYTHRKTIHDTLYANAPAILVKDASILNLNSNDKVFNCFNGVNMKASRTLPTDPFRKDNYQYGAAVTLLKTANGTPQMLIGDKVTFENNLILDTRTDEQKIQGNYGAGIYCDGGIITMGRLKENNVINIQKNYVIKNVSLAETTTQPTGLYDPTNTIILSEKSMSQPGGASWTYYMYSLNTQGKHADLHNNNIYLTRTAPASATDAARVTTDDRSDLVHVSYKLGPLSRIGITKWFPGYVHRDTYGRDTIGIVDYSVAGSLAASTNVKNKVFIDDSASAATRKGDGSTEHPYKYPFLLRNTDEYAVNTIDTVDVRYSNLLNPYKIYLHRCATFQKRDLDDVTAGNQYLVYNMNPDVVCPGDGDQISFGVTGGASAYTYNWYTKNDGETKWGTPVAIVSNETTGSYTPLNLHLATTESAKIFNLKVEAVESGGCTLEHYFDILVKQTGADDDAGSDAATDINGGHFYDGTTDDYVQNAKIDNWMGYDTRTDYSPYHQYTVPGVDTVVAVVNDKDHADKIARMYTYSKLNMLVSPETYTDYLTGVSDDTYTEAQVTDALGNDATHLRLCPGDLVNLSVTPVADYEFVSWDFDPSAPQATELVVTRPEQTVVAYLAPNAYWYKKINTFAKATEHAEGVQPGYEIDYHGSITIRNERGLAWLISTANGLNGQHPQTFIFDTITIMPKAGGYDMSAYKWTPIGNNRMPFRGVLVAGKDTEHPTWSADIKGITVNESELLYVGMFGITDSARISGLKLINSSIHGNAYAGGLIGYASDNTEIKTITMDGSNVVSGGSSVGGIAGKGTGVKIDSNAVSTRINGNALYVGAVCGEFTTVETGTTTTDEVVETFVTNNQVDVNINQASALYAGGMAGASVGTNTAVASDPFAAGRKGAARSSIHISNNRVKMGGSPNSFYEGGLIGNATNTDMENNFVYGSLNSLSMNGGLVAVVGSNVNMENCFYAKDDIDNEYGMGTPSVADNVSTFSGEGNQVLLSDTIGGTNNLTRVLNNWVREASGEYRTWRSDLEGQNDGYPYFGNPDMIPVRDTISDVVCDSYEFNGQTITESGVYSALISDSTLYIDSTITIVLTVNHSQYMDYADSVEVGNGYYGNGFSLSAEEIRDLMGNEPLSDVHVLQLVDSLLTENGCDSVVVLNLTIYNSEVGVQDAEAQFSISVYPNPTMGKVNVDADGLVAVEVYDAMSRKIEDIKATSDHCEFTLIHNASGSYYLRIITEHGTAVKKVVKR